MEQTNCYYAGNICYIIKVFPRSDDVRIFVESPIDKVVITK